MGGRWQLPSCAGPCLARQPERCGPAPTAGKLEGSCAAAAPRCALARPGTPRPTFRHNVSCSPQLQPHVPASAYVVLVSNPSSSPPATSRATKTAAAPGGGSALPAAPPPQAAATRKGSLSAGSSPYRLDIRIWTCGAGGVHARRPCGARENGWVARRVATAACRRRASAPLRLIKPWGQSGLLRPHLKVDVTAEVEAELRPAPRRSGGHGVPAARAAQRARPPLLGGRVRPAGGGVSSSLA